ncbi:MAG TPA: adenylate/guanylate cyclase domain-containing protein, partial [Methylomirabilota bacterium]|nr:adenylate/guanylate cyclase domain-containing protein [Methylomirabilota bacterium]
MPGPAARFCDACGAPLGGAAAPAADPSMVPGDRRHQTARQYTPRHLAEKILTSRSALEGERKQVTVVFADCVGFTELAAKVDPEHLHSIMDGCFQHLLDTVHAYEGTVNQFTGDGIMALFGAPVAHEDHAVRAVAAALDIQKRMRAYGDFLRADCGVEFAMRVSINTGPVVVGRIGDDLRMDYTAQGETVNLAARLQPAAPPGGVLVSEVTHRLVSGYFTTHDAGMLSLKGVERPVRAFAVTAQRSRRGRFDLAVERGLTPLVGRARELVFLRESWAAARAGRGQVVSLVGDAGVGKSRLAYELSREVEDVTRLEGRCLPHAARVPFHLVIEFLEGNFHLHDGDDER